MDTISRFQGEHRWLSNFAPVQIAYDGSVYPTVEHAYQAAKTLSDEERATIRACRTPGEAKRAGRRITIQPEWNQVKKAIMLNLLRLKFQQPHYAKLLLATGDVMLVEGNNWNDTYWGMYQGSGQNVLGQLLMRVRSELRG